jgi:hypothetical protein
MKTTTQIKVRETGEIVSASMIVGRDEFVAVEDIGAGTVSILGRYPEAAGVSYETLVTVERSSAYSAKEAALSTLEKLANGMDESEIADCMDLMRMLQIGTMQIIRPMVATHRARMF